MNVVLLKMAAVIMVALTLAHGIEYETQTPNIFFIVSFTANRFVES
jgi:hypothetical protein